LLEIRGRLIEIKEGMDHCGHWQEIAGENALIAAELLVMSSEAALQSADPRAQVAQRPVSALDGP
jgi:hypothetical protein